MKGITNIHPPEGVDLKEMRNRLDVLGALNQKFYKSFELKAMQGHEDMYFDAVKLMASKDIEAFDIKKEPDAMRARYGEHSFGRGCLLARRLVEKGVRFIDISHGGWDTHDDNFTRLKDTPPARPGYERADRGSRPAWSAQRHLDRPDLRVRPHPGDQSAPGPRSLSQGLLRHARRWRHQGRTVHGSTSPEGTDVASNKCEIPDLNATIAYGLGLPLDKVVTSPDGRPFTIARKGTAITDLFTA